MSKDEKIRKKSKKTPPCIDWIKHFPNGELPTIASGTAILLIAIDTEYQSNYT